MQITFKLYASLTDYLPATRPHRQPDAAGGDQPPERPPSPRSSSPSRLPPKLVHLVLVNGSYVPPEERATRTLLAEGDVLAIWPPIAGG
jgi:hypothetical protein